MCVCVEVAVRIRWDVRDSGGTCWRIRRGLAAVNIDLQFFFCTYRRQPSCAFASVIPWYVVQACATYVVVLLYRDDTRRERMNDWFSEDYLFLREFHMSGPLFTLIPICSFNVFGCFLFFSAVTGAAKESSQRV